VWDLATGQPLHTLTGHQDQVYEVALSKVDGRPVAVSGGTTDDDGTVLVWDLATGRASGQPFTGHRRVVEAMALGTVDGRPVVVSGGTIGDGTVRVWDLASGTAITTIVFPHDVRAIAAANKRLVVGFDREIAVLQSWSDSRQGQPGSSQQPDADPGRLS
jgi:WD40 repeat protein